MGWQVDEEANQDKTGVADEINQEVESKDNGHVTVRMFWF